MFGIHELVDLAIGDHNTSELDKRWLHILLHLFVDQSNLNVSQIVILNKEVESEAQEKLRQLEKCNLNFKYTAMGIGKDHPVLNREPGTIELSDSSKTSHPEQPDYLDDFHEIIDCCSIAVSFDDDACPSPKCPSKHEQHQPMTTNQPSSSAMMKSCQHIEGKICDIHKTILDALPTSEQLMDSCQNESNNMTLNEMFSTLNVSKRVDAIELGLVKLSNLIKEFNCMLDMYGNKLKKVDIQMEAIKMLRLEDVARKSDEKEETPQPSVQSIDPDTASTATQIPEEVVQEEPIPAEEPEETVKERANSDVENILDVAAAALSICLDESPETEVEATLSVDKGNQHYELLEKEIQDMKTEIFEKLQELEGSCVVQNDKFGEKFKEIRESLENIKTELMKNIEELKQQLGNKSDKTCIDDLKKYVEDEVDKLDDKISDMDLSKPVAALSCRAIKDISCLSCSKKAVQLDCVAGSKQQKSCPSISTKVESPMNKIHYNNPPVRLCGGIHTITGPKRKPCQ